jgi:ribosomal protein L44E
LPKPNYRQAKKQKEQSRKARQLEKQQRRTARQNGSGELAEPLQDAPAGAGDPTLSGT